MRMYKTLFTIADIFVPKILHNLFNTKKTKRYKPRTRTNDTTRIDQQMHRFICDSYIVFQIDRNKYHPRLKQQSFQEAMNKRLGLTKSITFYRDIWTLKTKRERLPNKVYEIDIITPVEFRE